MKIQVGKVYKANHRRKGVFNMLITVINGEWVKGGVVEGQTKALCSYNEKTIGDEVTVRKSFATFEEVCRG